MSDPTVEPPVPPVEPTARPYTPPTPYTPPAPYAPPSPYTPAAQPYAPPAAPPSAPAPSAHPVPAAPAQTGVPPIPPPPAGYDPAAGSRPPAQPAYPSQMYAPLDANPRPRRVWDVVLTVVLLVLGLFGTLAGVIVAAGLSEAIAQQGGAVDPQRIAGDQLVLVISHIALLLVALGVSIPLLVTRRIAFWVPLVCGVVASGFFWATLFGVVLASGASQAF